MDQLINFLSNYGYLGMLIAAFLAGSVFPFSSEAVMLALIAAGLNPMGLLVYGTVGNVAGSMFNYCVGRMGKMEWIEKYLRIEPEKIESTRKFMKNKGAWGGLLSPLPIIGSVATVTLGLMRANWPIVLLSVFTSKLVRYLILVGSAMLLTTSCSEMKPFEKKPTITVTIEPLRYFTEQIAGDKFNVVTMVPKGSSPETYEPTSKQMVDLSDSQLLIKAGNLGFEVAWMHRLQYNGHLIVIDSSENIQRISASEEGSADPHTWMSAPNALIIAENIYKALNMIDQKDSIYFRQRYEQLKNTIMETEITISEKLDSLPCRTFVIYHPALTYFANDHNLRQLAIENEGREPSAQSLQQLIDNARNDSVRVILVQQEFSNRNTSVVEKAIDAHTASINPLSYDWTKEMINIADILSQQ